MLSKDQAIKLDESKFWKDLSYREIAEFQMTEKLLCMPFTIFHEAMEKTLNRPVFTHEFGVNYEGLKKELFTNSKPPSAEDIINMIPEEKRILILT